MILIVDSFFTGSHRYWGEQLKARLPYKVELLTLSGKNWKWRMQGGAFELAEKYKKLQQKPSFIIATDMVNLPLFYAYAGITQEEVPCLLYFHENQFAYPISELDTDEKAGRENHYAFINLSSALFAKSLIFNSDFNKNSFLAGAQKLIKALPNNNFKLNSFQTEIIYPGVEERENTTPKPSTPILLWNHRWEHDKNPNLFLKGIRHLKQQGINFQLIILGKGTESPEIKQLFETEFEKELIHCGFVENKSTYWELVKQATILPVTSKHDFFGLSVAEAMQLGVYSILPNHQAYPEHLANNSPSGTLYNFPNGFDEALIKAVSQKSAVEMKKEFTWTAVIEKWTTVLSEKTSS